MIDHAIQAFGGAGVSQDTPRDRLAGFVRFDVRCHALHRQEASVVNAQLVSLALDHLAEAASRGVRVAVECLAGGGHSVPHERLTVYAILQECASVAGWFRAEGEVVVGEVREVYAALALKMAV